VNLRRWLVIVGVIVSAALLAFPLRGVVNQLIIIPLAYLLWALKLFYLSVPQLVWWILIFVAVSLILVASLLPERKPAKKNAHEDLQRRGAVEHLAAAMQKSGEGIYFKWLVANRLGRLAQQMLEKREHGKRRSAFAPLTGDGWNSTSEVQAYLEKGLHGSFAEYPNSAWGYFSPRQRSALDHDVTDVVETLESNSENT